VELRLERGCRAVASSHCSLLSLSLDGGGGSVGLGLFSVTLASESLLLLGGVLGTSGISLLLELLLTDGLGLSGVDGLDEDVLVLELVTLGGEVKLVVHLSVDLLGVSISLQKSTEDTESAHPEDSLGHTGLSGTLSLSSTVVATTTLGLVMALGTGVRVHGDLASHDEFVLDKLSDVLAY
jgi:hypothetical protein